ncbi:MAG: hypothetical protein IIY94_08995 [Oscillospiraceae bacterium]|nr:hypothetical protein [Oscillospiraceae bacterium]
MNLTDILFSRAVVVQSLDGQLQTLSASLPASASTNASGVLAFQNSAGSQLFTVQLPLYTGVVV